MCRLLQASKLAYSACSVVRMSLKSISCACSERPEVWMWYFSICPRGLAPYRSRIARAQIRRATRPITAYSGSIPLEKKKDRCRATSSMAIPRAR